MAAPKPPDEDDRLHELDAYDILDTPPEDSYDDIARLAAHVCDTPVALISFIDGSRQWFKAKVGTDVTETPRDIAFCAHAILKNDLMEVHDATLDERFVENPLVTVSPKIRFYAGAPLITPNGRALGTLCAIDLQPRTLTEEQRAALLSLSRVVMRELEVRRRAK